MRAAKRERAEQRLDEKIKVAERMLKSRQQDRAQGFDIG
jgi:hypothetical protein